MKIRKGFVSNSSSSSFICDICGETSSGWDASLSEMGMLECIHGHVFCKEEALDIVERNEDEESTEYGMVTETSCPICSFIEIGNRDMGRYLEKETGITRQSVFEEVKKVNKRRKKLKDHEYVETVCLKQQIDPKVLLKELKEKHKTYDAFLQSIRN